MLRLLPARSGFRTAAVSALLFCGTVLLFSRALGYGFVNYDDPAYVTANGHVQGGLSWAGLGWAFTAPADYWHPLTWLSHMLDWQLYGSVAPGHHLTSVLWHALNAVLAFLLFRRFGAGLWPGALAAALFAWHPLRVESVVWVSERKDMMSGCFFLLTLLAYARYVDGRAAGRRSWRAYLLTVACFAAGLMSKPMLVTLPLVMLVLDYWPFARWALPASRDSATGFRYPADAKVRPPDAAPNRGITNDRRFLLLEKAPFFALAGAVAVATVLMQRNIGAFVLDLPFGARAGNAVVSLARYLGKVLWPVDLIVCYPHPGTWPARAVAAAAALVSGVSWLAWRERHRRPWIGVGWLWFLIVLLPVLGLVQVGFQAMADRYTYLSLLGIEVAALWSLEPLCRRPGARIGAAAAGAVVLAACAARTWDQERVWRDSVSLFTHAIAGSDRNDVAEDFLASALFAANRLDEAAAHAERACALNPRNDTALITLGGIRERQGKLPEAAGFLRSALALRPDQPPVQCQLGLLELRLGRPDEARRLMVPALRSAPALRAPTLNLARAALQSGHLDAALFLYERVLDVAPDETDALIGAADIHARRRELTAAERLGRRAIAVAPDNGAAHAALGSVLIRSGDRAAGLAEWRRALELDPDLPGLREALNKAAQPP